MAEHKLIPAAVPRRLVQMVWLVAFAVMSAMLLSREKLTLNAERVEPPAIQAKP
jgi:hypothetical protein